MAYDLEPINPYLDPTYRQKSRERFTEALQPQIQQGISQVGQQVSPFAGGRRGASMMRDVYNPASQALSQFEVGQEEKGQALAAELPFKTAALRMSEAGLTGYYNPGLSQFNKTQAEIDAMAPGEKASYEMSRARTIEGGGTPTAQMTQMLLPYITQGYIPGQAIGGKLGNIKTERELSPEWAAAQQLGISDPFMMSLLAEMDPDRFKSLLAPQAQYGMPGGGSVPGGTPGSQFTGYKNPWASGYKSNQGNQSVRAMGGY